MYKVSLLMLQIVSGLMSLTRPTQEFRRLFSLGTQDGEAKRAAQVLEALLMLHYQGQREG